MSDKDRDTVNHRKIMWCSSEKAFLKCKCSDTGKVFVPVKKVLMK